MLHDEDDDFMPPRLRRAPNSCNDQNTDVTNDTMISTDDPNDDFMPARPQCYQPSSEDPDDHDHTEDDPAHTHDVFQDSFNYEDWKSLNRNFPFQPFY